MAGSANPSPSKPDPHRADAIRQGHIQIRRLSAESAGSARPRTTRTCSRSRTTSRRSPLRERSQMSERNGVRTARRRRRRRRIRGARERRRRAEASIRLMRVELENAAERARMDALTRERAEATVTDPNGRSPSCDAERGDAGGGEAADDARAMDASKSENRGSTRRADAAVRRSKAGGGDEGGAPREVPARGVRGRGGAGGRGRVHGEEAGRGRRGRRRVAGRVGRLIERAAREGARTPSTRASPPSPRSFSRGGSTGVPTEVPTGCRRGVPTGVPTGPSPPRVATVHAGGCRRRRDWASRDERREGGRGGARRARGQAPRARRAHVRRRRVVVRLGCVGSRRAVGGLTTLSEAESRRRRTAGRGWRFCGGARGARVEPGVCEGRCEEWFRRVAGTTPTFDAAREALEVEEAAGAEGARGGGAAVEAAGAERRGGVCPEERAGSRRVRRRRSISWESGMRVSREQTHFIDRCSRSNRRVPSI